jgi:hypothetical protein
MSPILYELMVMRCWTYHRGGQHGEAVFAE